MTGKSKLRAAPLTRQDVADCSAKLFDERGFHNVSMSAISAKLGIAKASLYHHIKSKEELLEIIHNELLLQLHASEDARDADPETADAEPAARIAAMVRDILELMATNRGHVRVFSENTRELRGQMAIVIKNLRDGYLLRMESHIRRGIECGYFRKLPVRITALGILGMCNWAYQWYERTGTLTTNEVATTFCNLFLNGLYQSSDDHPSVQFPRNVI